ncbi:MAG: hypothetical protein JWR67_73, partial [Mucilaginibacter sp.]|nr:hypothetical protein [Mucilaginibacter sp.]
SSAVDTMQLGSLAGITALATGVEQKNFNQKDSKKGKE